VCADTFRGISLSLLALLFIVVPATAQFGPAFKASSRIPLALSYPAQRSPPPKLKRARPISPGRVAKGFIASLNLLRADTPSLSRRRDSSPQRPDRSHGGNPRRFQCPTRARKRRETVEVSGAALVVNTESGNVAGAITAEQIERLPAAGRDPYELLRLAPGVVWRRLPQWVRTVAQSAQQRRSRRIKLLHLSKRETWCKSQPTASAPQQQFQN